MSLELLKIVEVRESKTNTRGNNFEGKAFEELVASIKEKGVLMPVLVRLIKTCGQPEKYEVIAGNRRLRAARKAGKESIPAKIVEMNDIEAQEAQIVENLQRQDVHPLEEGEAYRKLIEESKYETSAVAAKVGKSESYVKQRLFLTNLEKKPAEAYRSGKINDGIAVLIARLSAGDQEKVLFIINHRNEYNPFSVKELKKWIEENIYSSLENQPWLKSKELMEVVGKCQECEPTRASLFGPVKEGACTDLKCWNRKMGKYIDHRAKKEKLSKVSSEYGQSTKEIRTKSDYTEIEKKKERCESTHKVIIAAGAGLGKIIEICSNSKCKKHYNSQTEYDLTPEEKAKRKAEAKKEAEKQKKKDEDKQKKFQGAIAKIKYPLSQKHLDALLDFAFYRCGVSFQQPAAKLLGAEPVKREETIGWDEKKKVMRTNYEATLRAWAEKNGNDGKMRAIFSMIMPHPNNYDDTDLNFNNAIKKL